MKCEADRIKKRRRELKDGIDKLCSENESAVNILRLFDKNVTGRSHIEADQPELLSTIIDLVQASTAADDRRQTEVLRTVRTLDDLHSVLMNLGFRLS